MIIHERKRLFLRFLKARNAYPQYLHALKDDQSLSHKNSYDAEKWCKTKQGYGDCLIVCGFGWNEHPYPNVNWLKLHKLWVRLYDIYKHKYDK